MDFAFSADQDELRATARRLLADRLPPERLHALADAGDGDGTSSALWSELVGLGWVGLSAPEGGGSFLDEAVLLEEAGYALLPDPLLASVVCLPAVTLAPKPDPTAATVLAWAEPAGPQTFRSAAKVKTWATRTDGAWQLTGTKSDIADLGSAAQVVVLAASESGLALLLVEPTRGAVRLLPTTDGTRRIGTLTLGGTPAVLLAAGSEAAPLLTAMRRRAEAGLALESVGIAQRMLDIASEHAKQREQFGRVIGTYQAVSHHIADMYVRTELARSLAYRAAWCVATIETEPTAVTGQEVDVACAAAKAAATETAVFAAEGAIQVLGGIGMTWEHVAHRFYKRALANETFAGSPAEHRATVATAILGAAR